MRTLTEVRLKYKWDFLSFRFPSLFLDYVKKAKYALLVAFAVLPLQSHAEISDVVITDVTTKAFSVVWVSDAPVLSANVNVFSDAAGTQPVVGATINNISAGITGAHDNGIAKLDIVGLSASTSYFFSISSSTTNGTDVFPANSSLLQVDTEVETSKVNQLNQPIVNDLINYQALELDGINPTPGSIVILNLPSVSGYPISAFVESTGALAGSAILDLNNLFDTAGISVSLAGGENVVIKEVRGLSCAGLQNHTITRFSLSPIQSETPPVTTVETTTGCFISDRNCDSIVNILDFQFVLNSFNSVSGDCAFNPDADIVNDQVINILDAQGVLNNFGQPVP